MKRAMLRVLCSATLLVVCYPSSIPAAEVRLGDGIGVVSEYLPGANYMALDGGQKILLTPRAGSALHGQLKQAGWRPGTQFTARYKVVKGAAGGVMVDGIQVLSVPPVKGGRR